MSKVLRSFVFLAVLGVAGLLMLIAADRFERPALIGPGLLLFALGALGAGGDAIVRRHSAEVLHTTATRTFEGPAAVLTGLVFVILGFGLAVAGAAFVLGAQERLYTYLLARPGAALIAAGAAIASGGGASLLGAREWRGSARRFLAGLPERFGGLILLLLGLALVGIGIFEATAPDGFDASLGVLLAPLQPPTR